ncbi:MAG TPA: alpha/beta hydrolase [Thermohalobaculum sp.]|nr:alpha/beta hydrolase [Thermohalobaculum sp.]
MLSQSVAGGGGTAIHVAETGDPGGPPILFIHGWSQAHLCWRHQFEGSELGRFRLVAMDLRGHGMSGRPDRAEDYADGALWADDVAAVIDGLRLPRPVLVAWSYGGVVVGDYLSKYGADAIGGVNLVGGAVVLGPDAFGSLIGPGFLEHAPTACSPDLAESIGAVRALLRACTAEEMTPDDFETCLAFTMVVPPSVRGFLLARSLDLRPMYEAARTRLLVSHGRADTFVLPAMAEAVAARCPWAETAWYDGVGHAPFIEAPARFNSDLARFASAA